MPKYNPNNKVDKFSLYNKQEYVPEELENKKVKSGVMAEALKRMAINKQEEHMEAD